MENIPISILNTFKNINIISNLCEFVKSLQLGKLLKFSRTTMYKYVNLGVFYLKNIDLPRKVRYKKKR